MLVSRVTESQQKKVVVEVISLKFHIWIIKVSLTHSCLSSSKAVDL